MVVVQDVRDVPKEHQAVVSHAMNDRMRAALHKMWGEQAPAPDRRGS
ncbi:hypothetical protein [Streptomyces microflavus]|nr:hypothetical protein [Streptomyces microflavus]